MAPGNNGRHPSHTGTIPKTKARINCNVPQEAVTPTRRDMTTNLGTTSLDWVPVSEYNTRTNYSQTRKQTNNSSDQELTDLDNSVSFESGFGRFVPVRPQPRALPLNVQNRENITAEQHDDGTSSTVSGHTSYPYAHQMQNGLIPHSNHASAAVMIVNPTTPNTGNVSQPYNAISQNRNNLTRNLNPARNNFEGHSHPSNNNTAPPVSNTRSGTKTVNLMNDMYDQGQGSFNNHNENNHAHRESARALGEAIVAACPDATAVERRLSQIREYIRVTSSLVDTMRNSEDEQDVASRPVSAQSNGSAYSDNELWQNEIKNKMELSQMRLEALKQQQKRLLKYQDEAKQQLEEINRERQAQEQQAIQPSTSNDNFAGSQNQSMGNYRRANRLFAANQIGVATTLQHPTDVMHGQHNMSNNMEPEVAHSQSSHFAHSAHSIHSAHSAQSAHSAHSQEDRFSHREANIANGQDAGRGARDSEVEEDEVSLSERERFLQRRLRELKMKKQLMERQVQEFQKLQQATSLGATHNTDSSSGEESGEEEPNQKRNTGGNINDDDPFKLMEIKAIKRALQKTKDLMRSVGNNGPYQAAAGHEDTYRDISNHPNVHDNKSEGGGSLEGWSNEGSMCRVRNPLPQRHKFTNEQHSQQHHPIQQMPQQPSHETNLTSLQDLALELRMETENIMGERARLKDMISNKEVSRKQKKVNEEVRPGGSGGRGTAPRPALGPGPVERRQLQLRALLAEKQRELEALLNKEKGISSTTEAQKIKPDSRTASVVNRSYNSEQDEPDSRSEQILLDSQNSRDTDNYRGGGDSASGTRSIPALPSHLGSTYGSDSDSASRNKSNQRNRTRRRQTQERITEDNNNTTPSNNTTQNIRHEPRAEASNVNMVPPISQNSDHAGSMTYPHPPPQPCWNATKSNQDMRTNQFTQNSHSQTMEHLLETPQISFPPSVPFNMMMPYGVVGGCGCGCGFWGAWCWQQLVMQQREIHQLRDQLNHLEERWRAETASHTLNNQVPPGNRANNYWDNFRSYSRQNLLSANNKTNAEGHGHGHGLGLGLGQAHGHQGAAPHPQPLVERSHNTLAAASPCITPKRNTNAAPPHPHPHPHHAHASQPNNDDAPNRQPRRNVSYERSLSFSSAPDVLNVNQNPDVDAPSVSHSRNIDDGPANVSNININRQEIPSNSFRNLNITNPIPEIIQSHSNNLNSTTNSKKKSSSKLPAKNSTNRRNFTLDYSQTSNINIASTSEAPNPNLASTSREVHDKATSKLFDLLRENVYSEVTTLIDVNESHPDFLIQLFRELQLISSDSLRQKVLQSIRNVSSQYSSIIEGESNENIHEECRVDPVSTTSIEHSNYNESNVADIQNACGNSIHLDSKIVRFLLHKSDEICSNELLDVLASHILSCSEDGRLKHSKRRLQELLQSKYEGLRVCDVSADIIESLPMLISNSECDTGQPSNEHPESSTLQDVAGSLNLFSSSDSQLHQLNVCPYDDDIWPDHVPNEMDSSDLNDNRPRSTDEGKVDLLNCSEMLNGDLAEADQTCRPDMSDTVVNGHDELGANADALPDVVDTEEVTPTEAEAEWLGLDRVPTRLHMEEASEKQKD